MNLRSIDLNLLLVFDAVYTERSISRAALRLNLSQPAVSNALARLRDAVGDRLFVREGNRMAPTVRARSLREPVRHALHLLERGLRCDESFDFARSNREFVIAAEDYGETVVVPGIIDRIASAAPDIRLRIQPEAGTALERELREGTVDLAMDYFPLEADGFNSACVTTDSLVTLARIGHPGIGRELTLKTYAALGHVAVTPRLRSQPLIDLALAKRGLKRTIAITVPHFMSMPVIVQQSDLVCTLPRRMAELYCAHFRLQAFPVPMRTPNFPVYLIWHGSLDADPGHHWLRDHFIALCREL